MMWPKYLLSGFCLALPIHILRAQPPVAHADERVQLLSFYKSKNWYDVEILLRGNSTYVLAGDGSVLILLDYTKPRSPKFVRKFNDPILESHSIKVYKNRVYTAGFGQGKSPVLNLENISEPKYGDIILTHHNIILDSRGYLISQHPETGFLIYDIKSNPDSPSIIFQDKNWAGFHDGIMNGTQLILFWGDHAAFGVIDLSDPSLPRIISKVKHPKVSYGHSGWLSYNKKHLFLCDEFNKDGDITSWDISDPSDPELVGIFSDPEESVHNLIVKDGLGYTAFYSKGFRIFDVKDPRNIIPIYETRAPEAMFTMESTYSLRIYMHGYHVLLGDWNGLYLFYVNQEALGLQTEILLSQEYSLRYDEMNKAIGIKFKDQDRYCSEYSMYNLNGKMVQHGTIGSENQEWIKVQYYSVTPLILEFSDDIGRRFRRVLPNL